MNRQLQKVQRLPPLIADDPELEASFEEACDKLAELMQFSAEQLARREPIKYRTIVRMVAEPVSTRLIARVMGVSCHTVDAVRIREGFTIEKEKSRIAELARSASRLCLERLIELVGDMSARDLAIAAGVCIDKSQLLSDLPTEIRLNKGEQTSIADFNALLEQLPQANARVISDSAREVEDKK